MGNWNGEYAYDENIKLVTDNSMRCETKTVCVCHPLTPSPLVPSTPSCHLPPKHQGTSVLAWVHTLTLVGAAATAVAAMATVSSLDIIAL